MPIRHTTDELEQLIHLAHENRKQAKDKGLLDHFGRRIDPKPPKEDNKPQPHTHKSYCLKCRKTVDSITQKAEKNEKGTHYAVHGKCPTCATKTHTFQSKDEGAQTDVALATLAQTGGVS